MIMIPSVGPIDVDRYGLVRNQLQKLGYSNDLSPENLALTEQLVKDLMVHKEQIIQYESMMKNWEKEKRILENAIEPYQQDNGRLLTENNDLHGKLLKQEEEYEKKLKDLKKKNRGLESTLTDLDFINKYNLEKIKELHKESLEKNKKICELLGNKAIVLNSDNKHNTITADLPVLEISEPITLNREKLEDNLWKVRAQANDIYVVNMVQASERRIAELEEELEELKLDNQHQSDVIGSLKCQITQKDREIDRLCRALEGGRPISAVSRDYCTQCHQKDNKIKNLEEQLGVSVQKQHEAMNRAIHLAERNQHLERELKDIDNMALAVEEECQNKVKQNLKNMDILQDKLYVKINEIKNLERKVMDMKSRIEHDGVELENLKKEKALLERSLSMANCEKKSLDEKINHFINNEKNLKSEIFRLQEMNKSLQRHLGDMEERVMDILGTDCKGFLKIKLKKNSSHGLTSSNSHSRSVLASDHAKLHKDHHCICSADQEFDDYFRFSSKASLLDKIQQERDFYHNECHRLREQMTCLPSRSESDTDISRQLQEREKELNNLKQEAYVLRCENTALIKKLESCERFSLTSEDSLKTLLDRLEKERDMALSDLSRLQGERDALRERMKLSNESQLGEKSRYERIVSENEERIRRLESERRELINSQSTQRIALSSIEETCDEYKEQIRTTQAELATMTASYNQLRTLQEQTDRSLTDMQNRLSQTEIELRVMTSKARDLEKVNSDLESQIIILQKEKNSLKSNLSFVEKEKDGLLITLDEKTELVAKLENQITKKESYVEELKEKNCHLEKKVDITLSEKTSREHSYRALERTVEHLREELENAERQKEVFIRENRRLQDDLAAAAKDCITARRDVDTEKQEIENLKRQLQQYVNEVKKAEELLSKKESERNQMLDHFRSLSLEATALESNNHTLESTVESTKSQLISANNKVMELEHRLASKETLLYNYEKQISELTEQVADLESKLKVQVDMKIRTEDDLANLRDLCSTLDGQMEILRKQANNCDAEKVHLVNEVRRLSEECEGLNEKYNQQRSLSQTLEKTLNNSRQETLEHKITNKDLQSHIQHLRQRVEELTEKLESESKDVRRYQAQCSDLSQQVSELRREVTNARFEQAKSMEDNKRFISNSKPQSEEEYSCSFISSSPTLPPTSRTYTTVRKPGRRYTAGSDARYVSSGKMIDQMEMEFCDPISSSSFPTSACLETISYEIERTYSVNKESKIDKIDDQY